MFRRRSPRSPALLTGLAPALQADERTSPVRSKAGAREGTVHRSRIRVALLVTQAALSVVLLVGAGLFVRSLRNVQNVRLGYDTEQVLWVDIEEARREDGQHSDIVALREQLLRGSQLMAGVEEASRGLKRFPSGIHAEYSLFVAGIDSVSKLGDFTLQAGSPSLL